MKKIFTFMLSAAALLVSVPSWAFVEGNSTKLNRYTSVYIGHQGNVNTFGTICVPERIVAVKNMTIYDVLCVDVDPADSTKVDRLVVDVHPVCDPSQQGPSSYDETWCPNSNPNSYTTGEKTWIDWETYEMFDDDYYINYYHMVAGAAYFYTINSQKDTSVCEIWVDKSDVASEPVCQHGFYGTLEETKVSEPVTLLTVGLGTVYDEGTHQYVQRLMNCLEQVTSATIPAHRGYFKGYFECVPWRWNTDSPNFTPEFQAKWGVSTSINPLHYRCTPAPAVPRRVSSNAVMFNVGSRNVTTGLYPIDFEHPIYFNQETNKRIENGQLIIEAADGTKYNAFGQKL